MRLRDESNMAKGYIAMNKEKWDWLWEAEHPSLWDRFRSLKVVRYIRWIMDGKPMIQYSGFHCGCCGKWWAIPFEVAEYESGGEWWDGWGVCPAEEGSCWFEGNFFRLGRKTK